MTLSQSSRTWLPLLEGEPARRALRHAREIAEALRIPAAAPAPVPRFSLGDGDAGLALFFAYLAEAFPDDGYEDTALELLGQAIDGMGSFDSLPALYGGFPGVAWVVEHLQGRLLDPAAGDPGEEIAATLASYLDRSPWRHDFDLIRGLVGLGVFALERRPRSEGERCLELAVTRLGELCERSAQGITWLSAPQHLPAETRAIFPDGQYNLGVAHGLPGVIAFLGQTYAIGVAREETLSLLLGAVSWLLAQEQRPDAGSLYPYAIVPGGEEPRPSRLAWCYGDLGIAAALLSAARWAGEPAWEQRALTIARAATRRPAETSGVVDMGLCHGAAGAGHLFNRLYQASGEPAFADSARFWLEQALGMRRDDEGIAGFLAYVPDDRGEVAWRADSGFLTGVAGLGLALLAAATPVEPAWDRVMLAAIPPRPIRAGV